MLVHEVEAAEDEEEGSREEGGRRMKEECI